MSNRTRQFLSIFTEGPSTSSDLRATTGRSLRDVNVGLWTMQVSGYIKCVGRVRNDNNWPLKLWSLTPRGERKARAIVEASHV